MPYPTAAQSARNNLLTQKHNEILDYYIKANKNWLSRLLHTMSTVALAHVNIKNTLANREHRKQVLQGFLDLLNDPKLVDVAKADKAFSVLRAFGVIFGVFVEEMNERSAEGFSALFRPANVQSLQTLTGVDFSKVSTHRRSITSPVRQPAPVPRAPVATDGVPRAAVVPSRGDRSSLDVPLHPARAPSAPPVRRVSFADSPLAGAPPAKAATVIAASHPSPPIRGASMRQILDHIEADHEMRGPVPARPSPLILGPRKVKREPRDDTEETTHATAPTDGASVQQHSCQIASSHPATAGNGRAVRVKREPRDDTEDAPTDGEVVYESGAALPRQNPPEEHPPHIFVASSTGHIEKQPTRGVKRVKREPRDDTEESTPLDSSINDELPSAPPAPPARAPSSRSRVWCQTGPPSETASLNGSSTAQPTTSSTSLSAGEGMMGEAHTVTRRSRATEKRRQSLGVADEEAEEQMRSPITAAEAAEAPARDVSTFVPRRVKKEPLDDTEAPISAETSMNEGVPSYCPPARGAAVRRVLGQIEASPPRVASGSDATPLPFVPSRVKREPRDTDARRYYDSVSDISEDEEGEDPRLLGRGPAALNARRIAPNISRVPGRGRGTRSAASAPSTHTHLTRSKMIRVKPEPIDDTEDSTASDAPTSSRTIRKVSAKRTPSKSSLASPSGAPATPLMPGHSEGQMTSSANQSMAQPIAVSDDESDVIRPPPTRVSQRVRQPKKEFDSMTVTSTPALTKPAKRAASSAGGVRAAKRPSLGPASASVVGGVVHKAQRRRPSAAPDFDTPPNSEMATCPICGKSMKQGAVRRHTRGCGLVDDVVPSPTRSLPSLPVGGHLVPKREIVDPTPSASFAAAALAVGPLVPKKEAGEKTGESANDQAMDLAEQTPVRPLGRLTARIKREEPDDDLMSSASFSGAPLPQNRPIVQEPIIVLNEFGLEEESADEEEVPPELGVAAAAALDKEATCFRCNKVCANYASLSNHLYSHHKGQTRAAPYIFKCLGCQKQFRSHAGALTHVKAAISTNIANCKDNMTYNRGQQQQLQNDPIEQPAIDDGASA